jgi:hypothetical protein
MRDWLPDLSPPPRAVYGLIEEAREMGLWLRWARDERVRREHGGRYRISHEGSHTPLYVSDELDAIRAWLLERAQATSPRGGLEIMQAGTSGPRASPRYVFETR